jgi:hypothetical protein
MNKLIKILFLFLFCELIIPSISYSQHPGYYQLNDETGLPSNEVYKVIQDEFGYIWMGCDAGLYRYDGFEFKKYVSSKQNSNAISFLVTDRFNNIWCKNFYGQIFRVEGDSLRCILEYETSDPNLPIFDADDQGNIWVMLDNKLSQLNGQGKLLQSKAYFKGVNINGIKCHLGYLLLINSDLSVVKYDYKLDLFQKIGPSRVISSKCRHILTYEKGVRALIESDSPDHKFSLLKIEDNATEYFELELKNKEDRLFHLYEDKQKIWFASSTGLYNSKNVNQVYFANEKVSSVLLDKEGQTWVSTLQNGIYVIPEIKVEKYNSFNSSLNENNLVSVFENGPEIYFGSYKGEIFSLETSKKNITNIFADESKVFYSVKCITKNEKYTIISRSRLCIIENATGKQYFPTTSNVKDMFLMDDTLYMVHSNLISKVSVSEMIKTGNVNYTFLNQTGGKAVEYDNIYQKLYFLLPTGLFRNDGEKLNEVLFKGKSIIGNEMQFENGILWISASNGGIYGLKNEKLVYHFTDKNKLKEGNIRSFHSKNNRLWICTENYLQRISLTSDSISTYSTFHSINPKDINKILVSKGKVYLATNKGIVIFPENLEWKNTTRPRIKVLSILLDGKSIEVENNISLSYDHTNLRFNLSSVSLKSRGKYHYEYQLSGLENQWNSIPAQNRYIQFSSIPPGNYELKIRVLNESGVVSATVSYSISVEFPFWQKWWFYVLIGIFTASLVGLFFIVRIRYIRKKGDTKNKMLLSQLTALKSRMNPHFMFNSLNSIQHLIVKQDIKQSNLYISKFGKLMRNVLDVSGKEKISLQEEIEILELYMDLEKLRFGDDFKYELEFHEHLNTYNIDIPPMILQPFVENAIKHGLLHKKGEKYLKIEFKKEKELVCIITDNGIGRKKSEEIKKRQNPDHVSFATKATEEQMQLLQEYYHESYRFEIEDLMESGEATGTKVSIFMQME